MLLNKTNLIKTNAILYLSSSFINKWTNEFIDSVPISLSHDDKHYKLDKRDLQFSFIKNLRKQIRLLDSVQNALDVTLSQCIGVGFKLYLLRNLKFFDRKFGKLFDFKLS